MLSLLKQLRKFVNSQDLICIILGNESCDLDSAVCAVTLAYLYQDLHNQGIQLPHTNNATKFLPVLNISRDDYALKTEVNYVFQQHNISAQDLTFRSDLHQDFLARNDFILVDHHTSPFSARCVQVFDHRLFDSASQLPENCQLNLEPIGSCATLIAREYIRYGCISEPYKQALSMLYQTIVLDNVNFDKAAARATPTDVFTCQQLESILKEQPARDLVFANLVEARGNVSSLTALQLLRKDLKVLSNEEGSVKIALAGFPLSVQQFICKESAFEHIETFAQLNQFDVVLLMGLQIDGDSVRRDIGLIDIKNMQLWCAIKKELLDNTNLNLNLQPIACKSMAKACFYQQQNIKMTRKHIMPVIKSLLANNNK